LRTVVAAHPLPTNSRRAAPAISARVCCTWASRRSESYRRLQNGAFATIEALRFAMAGLLGWIG
jgi:hypothetical protein